MKFEGTSLLPANSPDTLTQTLVAPGLKTVPAGPVTAELSYRMKCLTPSTPGGAFGADLSSFGSAAGAAVIAVALEMREGDVIQGPEKLYADAFPRLLMLDAQLVGRFDLLRALETDVLAVPLQEREHHHLPQTVGGRAMRHAKKGTLASATSVHSR
ncbi:MAG TPA: hypothetical protein VN256_25365 [Pyrinomonadaceae bacterium]|nr:hypothetical protein [Pyrinomonadaceae bacterium]